MSKPGKCSVPLYRAMKIQSFLIIFSSVIGWWINHVPRNIYVFNTYSVDAARYIILSHCLTEASTVPVLPFNSLKIVILMTTDEGL